MAQFDGKYKVSLQCHHIFDALFVGSDASLQLIGTENSYFTIKLRSYMRYKKIPFVEVEASPQVRQSMVGPKTGGGFIPGVCRARSGNFRPFLTSSSRHCQFSSVRTTRRSSRTLPRSSTTWRRSILIRPSTTIVQSSRSSPGPIS